MIKKKSKESFIAFREALKFKFCLPPLTKLSLSLSLCFCLACPPHPFFQNFIFVVDSLDYVMTEHDWLQTKQLATVGELQPCCRRCWQCWSGKCLRLSSIFIFTCDSSQCKLVLVGLDLVCKVIWKPCLWFGAWQRTLMNWKEKLIENKKTSKFETLGLF